MSEAFPNRPLAELTLNFDAKRRPVKASDRKPGPFPYYGAQGIVDYVHDYIFDGEYMLVAEDGENLRSRKEPIALLAKGKFWVNNHAHILQGNEYADTRFLYYAINRADISGYITGSTIPKLSQSSLNRIMVPCPSLAEQLEIVRLLGSLDDKIELNRQMNETLEAMAQAIFRDWFVDFGPTRRKMEGVTDPVEVMGGLVTDGERARQLADLFPAKLGDGGPPEGWREERIASVTALLKRGLAPSYSDDGILVVNQKCIRDQSLNFGLARRHNTLKRPPKERLLEEYDVLVNSTGMGTLGRVATVRGLGEPATADSHVTICRADTSKVSKLILSLYLESKQSLIETMGHGSTGQTELSPASLGELVLVVPPPKLQTACEELVGPWRDLVTSNISQSQTLTATRDLLLPKLMSGEIRLRDAEEHLEAAQ